MSENRIAIVGGGASGLVAAIVCARNGSDVTVFEAGGRPGVKVLKSGNGRCNLSNSSITKGCDFSQYNEPSFVSNAIGEFDCEFVRDFFRGIGLLTFEDSEGRIYPITNASASVVECLTGECRRHGIPIHCGNKAHSIRQNEEGWTLTIDTGEEFEFDKIILAMGNSTKLASKAGLFATSKQFVLGPLATNSEYTAMMDGVRIRAGVSVLRNGERIFFEEGEVLFRKYGVSGIVIFNASRYADYADDISIDLVPSLSEEELLEDLERRNERFQMGRRTSRALTSAFSGLLNANAIPAVLDYCGVDCENPPSALPIEDIAFGIKNFELSVTELPGSDAAQVTRGGISLDEVDPNTLEANSLPGLFLCGEILDIDGACGGFNLHWAWASAMVAAQAASK